MSNDSFGIYILTYPGDFHLSSILVRSIQQVSPGIPIMVIPGEGFDRDNHPFDVPIMPEPGGLGRNRAPGQGFLGLPGAIRNFPVHGRRHALC